LLHNLIKTSRRYDTARETAAKERVKNIYFCSGGVGQFALFMDIPFKDCQDRTNGSSIMHAVTH
jgi:hypothetical protein